MLNFLGADAREGAASAAREAQARLPVGPRCERHDDSALVPLRPGRPPSALRQGTDQRRRRRHRRPRRCRCAGGQGRCARSARAMARHGRGRTNRRADQRRGLALVRCRPCARRAVAARIGLDAAQGGRTFAVDGIRRQAGARPGRDRGADIDELRSITGATGVSRLRQHRFAARPGRRRRRRRAAVLPFATPPCVASGQPANLPAPVDGVCTSLNDAQALGAHVQRARRLGFGGQLCIHSSQVAAVNAGFRPTVEQLDWAPGHRRGRPSRWSGRGRGREDGGSPGPRASAGTARCGRVRRIVGDSGRLTSAGAVCHGPWFDQRLRQNNAMLEVKKGESPAFIATAEAVMIRSGGDASRTSEHDERATSPSRAPSGCSRANSGRRNRLWSFVEKHLESLAQQPLGRRQADLDSCSGDTPLMGLKSNTPHLLQPLLQRVELSFRCPSTEALVNRMPRREAVRQIRPRRAGSHHVAAGIDHHSPFVLRRPPTMPFRHQEQVSNGGPFGIGQATDQQAAPMSGRCWLSGRRRLSACDQDPALQRHTPSLLRMQAAHASAPHRLAHGDRADLDAGGLGECLANRLRGVATMPVDHWRNVSSWSSAIAFGRPGRLILCFGE